MIKESAAAAIIITDKHVDGRLKKVEDRARKRRIEARDSGGEGDARECETPTKSVLRAILGSN